MERRYGKIAAESVKRILAKPIKPQEFYDAELRRHAEDQEELDSSLSALPKERRSGIVVPQAVDEILATPIDGRYMRLRPYTPEERELLPPLVPRRETPTISTMALDGCLEEAVSEGKD